MERTAVKKYLFWTFLLAWILQIVASVVVGKNGAYFSVLLSITMFIPLLGTWIAKKNLKGIGWKPIIKKRKRYYIAAWFFPAILGGIGAVLYYLIFSNRLDLTGQMLLAQVGEEGLKKLTEQGLSIEKLLVISAIQALTYAPWLNMLFAVGEETGWRGFLYPYLKKQYGVNKGRIIGGIIWGVWHWPVMILAGYEYGSDYVGAPILGLIIFCIFTISVGIILDVLYEKAGSIWAPALGHGAINAFAGVPVMVLHPDFNNALILGPLMIGIISGIPIIITACYLMRRENRKIEV